MQPTKDYKLSYLDLSNIKQESFYSKTATSSETECVLQSTNDNHLLHSLIYLESSILKPKEDSLSEFDLGLKGNLPDCGSQLRIFVSEADIENRLYLEVYSVKGPNQESLQVLSPFETNCELGAYSSGYYSLWVNGLFVTNFISIESAFE